MSESDADMCYNKDKINRKGGYMVKAINSRAIDDDFLDEFLNGKLNKLLQVIQQDDSLIMCLRGNYTDVYYRSCCILEISKAFNFSVNKNYGISPDELNGAINFDKKNWTDYFRYAKELIDKHSFKKRTGNDKAKKKTYKLEKDIQQLMFKENSYNSIANETDYFIFDIEYDNGEIAENIDGKIKISKPRFDALAISLPKNDRHFGKKPKTVNLALIEIKAGLTAINEADKNSKNTKIKKASLSDHYNDVITFMKNTDKADFLKEMKKVFNQMVKLGLINIEAKPENISLDNDSEIQFIFVLANYNDNSVHLKRALKKMDENVPFKTYFATSSFMGYGLYEKCMISLSEMKQKYEDKI